MKRRTTKTETLPEKKDLALFGRNIFGDAVQHKKAGELSKHFVLPPFTVLNAREGAWQRRKRAWLSQGIVGELGRNGGVFHIDHLGRDIHYDETAKMNSAAGRLKGQCTSLMGGDAVAWMQRGPQDGGSVFDPVLCELMYTWFCPKGGQVLDPFAGGSVRGIVAATLGYQYWGCDLRLEQIQANYEQAKQICPQFLGDIELSPTDLTPVEKRGAYYFKRDDLFQIAGVRGGKARTCAVLAKDAKGLITAGSKMSPQAVIVAAIAKMMGIPCRIHTPEGEYTKELQHAKKLGAEIIQHKAGYNSVIVARAAADANQNEKFTLIPFGMECVTAVQQTSKQVANLPPEVARLVVPVGSGMTLAGILHGLVECKRKIPVVAVMVGADPIKRLDKYAPLGWRDMVYLVKAQEDYHTKVDVEIQGIELDPIYEAKCVRHMSKNDCLWIVGHRGDLSTIDYKKEQGVLRWQCGDSRNLISLGAPPADFVFSCPPYGDLEKYSDDPADISNMDYLTGFVPAYQKIVEESVELLNDDSFACFVVGEFRDKKTGCMKGIIADTMEAFWRTKMELYNEAVLVTAVGSLPVRTKHQFTAGRKMGKSHQNVLVFVKGNPDKAAKKIIKGNG